MVKLTKIKVSYIIMSLALILIIFVTKTISADQKIKIIADEILVDENDSTIKAIGKATAISNKGNKLKSDILIYNENKNQINAEGNIILNDVEGNTYFFETLQSDDEINNLQSENIRMRMEDGSRVVGSSFEKKNDLSVLKNAEYTPCLENDYLIKNCPGWKLKSKRIYQNNDTKTISYDHAQIHLFNIPILYLPYFSHPDPSVKKRSGFLMPTAETDQNLGDTFSIPIFYNLKSNLDFTFTPTIQSKSNNFYSLNYRQLNELGSFNVDTSIDDNDDDSGTSSHFFFDADINNSYGSFDAFLQSSNNDTYMRKNKINNITVLKSGINFERSYDNTYLAFDTIGYKHLAVQGSEQWEYIYPRLQFNISDLDDPILNGDISLKNQLEFNKGLNNSYTSLASSQIDWHNNVVNSKNGLAFDNGANFRLVSISIDNKNVQDTDNIRFYPQIYSVISYPLIKNSTNLNQTISPMIMPVLAPYNNYTEAQSISSSNLFSHNRATSIQEWESGPRINYGIDWFIDNNKNANIKLTLGQSYRINKNSSDSTEEISDYFLSSNASFKNNYINNSIVFDRKDVDVKSITMNTYSQIYDLQLKVDYDYTSGKYGTTNEQVAIGGEYNFKNNFFMKFTGTKDIDTNKNIGYQYGILYEDNCLGIDFNYYRDLTIDRDIKESDGYSFTIVLKPFGSTRSYGKSKVFGPTIQ